MILIKNQKDKQKNVNQNNGLKAITNGKKNDLAIIFYCPDRVHRSGS